MSFENFDGKSDLAPDFFLFPKLKEILKGTHSKTVFKPGNIELRSALT